MELSWIDSFTVLSECGSIRSAAAQLGISASAMSARIASLESYLGVELFEKTAHGSVLTDRGRIYLKEAGDIITQWNDIVERVRSADEMPSTTLKIAFQGTLIPESIMMFLDEYIDNNPHIALSLLSDTMVGAAESLSTGHVDIYFACNPSPALGSSFKIVPVISTRLAVLVSAKHRLISRDSVSLADLEGETFIIYPPTKEKSLRDFQLSLLRTSGIRHMIYECEASPRFTLYQVRMNYGITFYPDISEKFIPPRTKLIHLTDEECRSDYCIIYNPANENPILKDFLDHFTSEEML